MPDPNVQQEAQGGGNAVTDALNKQIGPLKAWQWGIAVGGAVLLYMVISGRTGGGSGTNTTVPFTSGTDPNTPSGAGPLGDTGDPIHVIVDAITPSDGSVPVITPTIKKLLYTSARVVKQAPIVDKNGKVIGHLTAGRTILLGAKVKINGKWLYPILNMPGKYVGGGSNFRLTPVYQNEPASALSPISNAVAAPTTTLAASAAHLYQPGEGTDSIAPPSADNGYQLSAAQTQLPTISH